MVFTRLSWQPRTVVPSLRTPFRAQQQRRATNGRDIWTPRLGFPPEHLRRAICPLAPKWPARPARWISQYRQNWRVIIAWWWYGAGWGRGGYRNTPSVPSISSRSRSSKSRSRWSSASFSGELWLFSKKQSPMVGNVCLPRPIIHSRSSYHGLIGVFTGLSARSESTDSSPARSITDDQISKDSFNSGSETHFTVQPRDLK